MYETLISTVKGKVENKYARDGKVTVVGWAFSEVYGVCPIRCKYDGTLVSVDIQARSDIVDTFQNSNILLCGWSCVIPLNKYVDVQIKLGSEWSNFMSFNTFVVAQEEMTSTPQPSSTTVNSATPVEPAKKGTLLDNNVVQVQLKNNAVADKISEDESVNKMVNKAINEFLETHPDISVSNTAITVVNFSITQNHLSNFYVLDNFYTNPDDIRKFGILSCTNNYSNSIKSIPAFKNLFERLLGVRISSFDTYPINGQFECNTLDNKVVLNTKTYQYGGVVFLTPNAPLDAGITLFRSKHTKSMLNVNLSSEDKEPTDFEKVDTVANVYNRLVLFNTKLIHANSRNFGKDYEDGRLVQIFAFDLEAPDAQPAYTKKPPSTTNISLDI